MRLHVTRSGTDVENAPVYLFTEQGSYLGLNEKTGVDGEAVFSIPARTFKFRVDYEGTQYWTEGFNILAHEETIKEVIIEQLALDLTNNPRLDRFDGKPPTFKAEPIRVASIGSLTGLLVEEETDPTPREKVYYFINDHLGTPRKLMDETGSIVWSADYQPFGAANNITGSVDNNFRFPGQYYDEETGLHYNYHRYYDPGSGRYLRADPIGLTGGINLFSYVQNNPVNLIDALGLYCKIIWDESGTFHIRFRREQETINYWPALIAWTGVQMVKFKLPRRFIVPTNPIEEKLYEYQIVFTIYEMFGIYRNYYEVCFDDCTGDQISKTLVGREKVNKGQQAIYETWTETRTIR